MNYDGDTYWSRTCDSCHALPCVLYCHADSAYLCHRCDDYIHAPNPLASQHEHVWVCTACGNAPAALTCHSDAANLCINCDVEIHSANPLAGRHTRVPVTPISGSVNIPSTTCQQELLDTETEAMANQITEELEENEADSWLLFDIDYNENQTNSGFTRQDVNQYLDLVSDHCCRDQTDQQQLSGDQQGDGRGDSVVPVQSFESQDQKEYHHQHQQEPTFVDGEYGASKASFVNTTCTSQKVPLSYMDAGYLLSRSNIPNAAGYVRFPKGTTDLLPNPSRLMPLQFPPMNREAKVLRYRQKRKALKFEKKIRYVTRKANAENRLRVKGRFARKKDINFELDQMFRTEDYSYGIVPSYPEK